MRFRGVAWGGRRTGRSPHKASGWCKRTAIIYWTSWVFDFPFEEQASDKREKDIFLDTANSSCQHWFSRGRSSPALEVAATEVWIWPNGSGLRFRLRRGEALKRAPTVHHTKCLSVVGVGEGFD